jgi:hypothetical protein
MRLSSLFAPRAQVPATIPRDINEISSLGAQLAEAWASNQLASRQISRRVQWNFRCDAALRDAARAAARHRGQRLADWLSDAIRAHLARCQ